MAKRRLTKVAKKSSLIRSAKIKSLEISWHRQPENDPITVENGPFVVDLGRRHAGNVVDGDTLRRRIANGGLTHLFLFGWDASGESKERNWLRLPGDTKTGPVKITLVLRDDSSGRTGTVKVEQSESDGEYWATLTLKTSPREDSWRSDSPGKYRPQQSDYRLESFKVTKGLKKIAESKFHDGFAGYTFHRLQIDLVAQP